MNVKMPSDADTTIAELRSVVSDFVDARDWHQFHRPKNLAMSIAIEAAELMEHFQWLTHEQADDALRDENRRTEICDEMADVVSYVLALANALNIDVTESLHRKMEKNIQKYPADEFRGRYGRHDQM